MRKIRRLVSNKALQYLRGATDYQFRDRISKVVGDCIDQINEFFNVLANVQDGKDGKDGATGASGAPGADGHTPYILNNYWYINGVNTGVKAKGEGGGVSSWNDLEDKPNWLDIVTISDSAGTLTEEQLALVSTNHCMVSYNGVYYYKTSSTSTICIYSKLQAVITEVDIIQHRIEINLTTGAYTCVGTEYDRLIVSGNVVSSESDVTLQTLKIGNETYKIPNGTNTHRPIQVDGVQILGNNDTPINFVAGSNVTITSEEGTVTISSSGSGGESSGEDNVIEGIKISGENDVITPDSKIVTIPIMAGSGTNHRSGLVPDPGSTAGTSKYLREDGTWQTPPDNNTTYSASDFDIKDLADSTSLKEAWNGKQDVIVFNTAYNASSNKAATMLDISGKENKLTITVPTIENNTFDASIDNYYIISGEITNLTINLPYINSTTKLEGLIVYFTIGASAPNIVFTAESGNNSNGIMIVGSFEKNKTYEVNAVFNNVDWVITVTPVERYSNN